MAATLAVLTATGFAHAPITLVSSIAGFAGYAVVLREWPAERAGSFAVLNTVVPAVLGELLLDESLTSRMSWVSR